ncbi:MAG TPA: XRE family transcriptional regulator [Steroidobacteraceae bacterium]|nr:XRE family transcriptional regulator [Steroidobacteraceae bacterium]
MSLSPASPAQARIGRAIRQRRQGLGLSLGETAAQLGVAISTLSKLENGLVPITFERLDAISRLLKVDMAALLAEAPQDTTSSLAESGGSRREKFGVRKSVTRAQNAVPVDGGAYTLHFHGADLLEKHVQPLVAEIHVTDIKEYGPYTRHPGEEFNYVLSGEMDFHTDVYAPVRLKVGDSVYFDAEMGHAHTRVGNAKCTILSVLIPRSSEMVKNNTAPVLEVTRTAGAAREPVGRPPRRPGKRS